MSEQVTNWFGNIDLRPSVIVRPSSAAEIADVMLDQERYPSPVRAAGSHHSTTECGVVDGGTLLEMRGMDAIIEIAEDFVTVQAGALYIDVAKRLREHGLQFYVNVEIGNLTMGSAACGGTKDASLPGEYGQVSSYAIGIKMVTASGELVEVTEEDPTLLQAVRSSYGLFGVIYEVTFRVRPERPMSVHHEGFSLDQFTKRLGSLRSREEALMLYIDPYNDRIMVEFRRYIPHGRSSSGTSWQWKLRNYVWSKGAPYVSQLVSNGISSPQLRNKAIDVIYKTVFSVLDTVVQGGHTYASDQMIRYPEMSGASRYTFSIWAFSVDQYAETLRAYFAWILDYTKRTGYRPDMIHVGYRIASDQEGLFSYSFDGEVMTIDPVSTGTPGWDEFLVEYNQFCSDHGGVPLFNQTHLLTPAQVKKAFGERLGQFAKTRERFDPNDRLLTDFFSERLL